MGASQNYNVNLNINANAQSAQQQLQKLQQQLQQISSMKIDVEAGTTKQELQEAAQAALELQMHLKQATNLQTGNLDFTKLSASLKKSKVDIVDYANTLAKVGPAGQQAFIELAQSVSKAEIPMRRISESTQKMWDGFKRTAGWQLQSSVIHGVVGGVQKALGYAKDLNKSLTDIRIVTGSSADEMARFAQRANDAAKKLSTTTTDYTRASLIYYQQGLSDAEVKARTEATIKMANATGTSAQQVSDQMTAIWNNYADGSKQLTHYADVMTALGAATASSTDEIAQGLQKFASISNTVGLSYEYAASALATITAESRESADVVGNALKTLFSRIQGLQLGKTLDDGTTLNKYSTALAKVGISIKDQTGGLKDMDDILDEMGSKWDTLARDEKMALAQTVAGVRQYTQLMTLMENWDDFKTNLNTANTSTGTLDRQAAIYADSWEAASNRVRASFEGLWDNLINSDGFINALDAFSSFIDIIDQMISGLGGAKGAFLTFGGILGQVFNKEITSTISNFAYNIKMLSPKFLKAEQNKQIATLRTFSEAYKAGNLPMGKAESNIRSNITEQIIKDKQAYWKMAPYLSQTQQEYYNNYSNLIDQNREARVLNAQEQDALSTKIGTLALDTMADALNKDYYEGGKLYDDIEKLKASTKGKKSKQAQKDNAKRKELEEKYYGQGAKEGRKGKSTRKALLNDVAESNSKTKAAVENASSYEEIQTAMQDTFAKLGTDSGEYFKQVLEHFGNDTDKAMKYMKEQGADIITGKYRDKVIDDIDLTDEEKKKYKGKESEFREGFRDYTKTIEDLRAKERRGEQLTEREQQLLAGQKGAVEKAKVDTTEAVVAGAMGAMQALAAGESLNALMNSLGDGTATLTSTLTSMTSALMSGAMGVQGLTKAAGAIPGVTSAAAGWIGIVVAAVLAAITVISDIVDKATVSDKELTQNLATSDNELTSSTQATSEAIEQYKTQNESYLKTVEKIKSLSYDPSNMAEDIFQANKQALGLIEQYGLNSHEYSTNSNGLIEIDKDILDSKVKQQKAFAKEAEYAQILGQAMNNIDAASLNYDKIIEQSEKSVNRAIDNGAAIYRGMAATMAESAAKSANIAMAESTQAFTYKQLLDIWTQKEAGDAKAESKWNNWVQEFAEVDWKAIELAFKDQKEAGVNADYALDIGALSSARVLTNKLLSEQGITADNKKAYSAYAENIAKQAAEDIKNGEYQLLDPSKNVQLTADQQELVRGYLEKYYDVQGAGQFKVENGQVMYKGEGDTEYQHVMASTINGWYAQEQMSKKMVEYQEKANKIWSGIETESDGAAQHIKEFNTISGANAQGVLDLFKTRGTSDDKWAKAFEGTTADQDSETAKVERIKAFTNEVTSIQAEGVLEHMDLGTLENITNSISKGSYSAFNSLVESIISGSKMENAEDIAKLFTALSNLDFSGNEWLNLNNIESILNDLGYTDVGNLPEILAYLQQIVGLKPPENSPKDDYDDAKSNKKILNKIKSGGVYDTATKEAAEAAGLKGDAKGGGALWVQDTDGNWHFHGTQEDIDGASQRQTNAMIQADAQAKADHDAYTAATKKQEGEGEAAKQTYDSPEAFARDLYGAEESTDDNGKPTGKGYGYVSTTKSKEILDKYGLVYDNGQYYDPKTGEVLYDENKETSETNDPLNLWNRIGGEQSGFTNVNRFINKTNNVRADYYDTNNLKYDGTGFYEVDANGNPVSVGTDGKPVYLSDSELSGYAQSAKKSLGDFKNAYMNGPTTPQGTPNAGLAGYMQYLADTEKDAEGNPTIQQKNGVWQEKDADGNWVDITDFTNYQTRYNNSANNPETTTNNLSQFTAEEIIQGVKSKSPLLTKDGVITQEAIDQLSLYAEGSERLLAAQKDLQAAKDSGVGIDQAMENWELAHAIESVAAARGLDAEQVAIQAEAIQSNFTGEINGVKIQGQLTAEAIADMAAEMIAASNAATKLKSKSKDLYKDINSKDAAAASSALAELEKDVIALIGAEGDAAKAGPSFRKYLRENQDVVEAAANGNEKALNKLRQAYVDSSIAEGGLLDDVALAAKNLGKTEDFNNIKSNIAGLGEAISSLQADGLWNVGEALTRGLGGVGDTLYSTIDGLMALGPAGQAAAQAIGDAFGFNVTHVDVSAKSLSEQNYKGVVGVEGVGGAIDYKQGNEAQALIEQGGTVKIPVITPKAGGGSGKAGGGGGGGGKEPKKVAQTRRSQVVKRYKNVDAQRAANKNRRDNMSKKTDKLYGESRITNLQKENKLLEEGLKLNEKKAEEALKNLKIDEESLRKMTKKYGYELELDSEGNIKNYEQILGDIYDQLHKLELDGELSEEEEKIKEELEIRKQEIEGAMEDWEDTLKQLEELNNEYEELIDEMHSNELEQITYKLEFELELNELDTEWYDFLNEQIGDDFTQAVDTMDLITEKIKIANDDINLYKQSVTDLMENIENDPNRSLVTGYLVDGVLTDEEAEILKEAYSGIIEQLNVLAEAKTAAEELLVSIFEGYKERINLDTTALEHYTSLLEHFGNVVDIVGQKQLGLSDRFMENMAKMRIQQSKDIMSAAQSELAAYEQIRAKAEEELARAREEGRTNDIDYWQQQLNDANTSIQEARDKLVNSFEDILNAIADAFDRSVERVVQTFNDAVYAFGGLEGLSQDYSFIRENTELMAQDYEKIYELSKLNRNINKTLNDNNIIAGKQKMIELQKEINDLQASGAELSKYDLEYLQAKYELRLAEIELENAQNAKETVRLSKDSEGNWSYVYTASTEKIDEAQQKYEDALYKMQNLSYEYIDEMSEKIISTSQAMMEEIQNLNKNNFENEQEYLAEINRIKAKYAESLGITEEELNKALANNEELYDKDWQSYSNKTGYAISESQNWIDRYAESTLGTLMKSTSDVSDYMNNFALALDELTNSLYRVASDYYNGIDDAFAAAGITKEEFASFVTTNTKAIMDASTNTKKDIETQTSTLVKEYRIQADKVTEIQRILDAAIDEYGPYIKEIRDILKESAALTKELQNKNATYTYKQAADLFNSKYGDDYKIETDDKGRWKKTVEGVKNEILQKHAAAKTDEEKKYYADMYTWLTSYILPYVTSLDTGGYTGEWGTSGRLAMLHEKELILNANDTANFLDALNVSRELVNKVIEMNARASSFGIGGLSPSSIQDFAQNLEQQVTITAEFPNAVDHNEIEEAFASLINTASQYANRK